MASPSRRASPPTCRRRSPRRSSTTARPTPARSSARHCSAGTGCRQWPQASTTRCVTPRSSRASTWPPRPRRPPLRRRRARARRRPRKGSARNTTRPPVQTGGRVHLESAAVAPLVSVRDLEKTYPNGTRALDGVTLDIQRGEFVVLIGLSGSGKSTLLRTINRLVDPTAGTVTFDGVDVTHARGAELRRIRRRIGMIFQQFNLVRRSSVFSNVLAGRLGDRSTLRTTFSRPRREEVAAAFENLARVGIVDKAYQRADALSGGQQQRVGI